MSDRFLIVGAGAIGAITGVHLARAGHHVAYAETSQAHVDAVRRSGLRLSGALEATIRPDIATPDEISGQYDTVLLAVKARHTNDTLPLLQRVLGPEGCVVSLQNGLEEYKLADALGKSRVIGAYLTFGGFYVEPGHVKYGGTGSFKLGELDGHMSERLAHLARTLKVQQPVQATDNIFGFLWAKMALGAVYFGTAITDLDVPEVYTDPERRAVLATLCGETVAVAEKLGVSVETTDGFDPKAFRLGAPADGVVQQASWDAQRRYWGRHDNARTGIWRDLAIHRRPTEIDGLVDEVIRLAGNSNVPVPHLQRLSAVVHAIERGEQEMSPDALLGIGG